MKKSSRVRTGCSGFTQTELLVACGIAAVMAAIAATGFSSWVSGYRLKAAARDLYAHMQRAKMAAIRGNSNCSITYSQGPDCYVLSGITKTVNLADYGSGVRFEGPKGQTFSVPTITFNFRGRCNAGYAYLTDEKKTAYYRVGPSWSTGVIRFEEYLKGKWE